MWAAGGKPVQKGTTTLTVTENVASFFKWEPATFGVSTNVGPWTRSGSAGGSATAHAVLDYIKIEFPGKASPSPSPSVSPTTLPTATPKPSPEFPLAGFGAGVVMCALAAAYLMLRRD